MPYFYLEKGPNLSRYRRHRRQEHSKSKNHSKIRTKQGPGTKANFLRANPERTGNPSKNPKKHYKKPLPPREVYGREEGGWLGWLGWAGWVTAEAGLAGLAGLAADVDG